MFLFRNSETKQSTIPKIVLKVTLYHQVIHKRNTAVLFRVAFSMVGSKTFWIHIRSLESADLKSWAFSAFTHSQGLYRVLRGSRLRVGDPGIVCRDWLSGGRDGCAGRP